FGSQQETSDDDDPRPSQCSSDHDEPLSVIDSSFFASPDSLQQNRRPMALFRYTHGTMPSQEL
ncbi:MAG TPA: hypothetical protein VMW27_12140, partial [Thermoanaerobaculia bacterium]|nr:hypothetical protein [Thermoanaerobaculia bacterium]